MTNWYKAQLDIKQNAMYRECADKEIETGLYKGIKRDRDNLIVEFHNEQDQLRELIECGCADTLAKNQYLDICAAIGE